MDQSPRDEMLQLLRDLGAQLAWQRDAGLLDTPSQGPLPVASVVAAPVPVSVSAPAPARAEPPPPAPVAVVAAPLVSAPPTVPVPMAAPVLPEPVKVPPPAAVVTPIAPANFEGRAGALRVIQEEVRACRACKLAPTRTQTVFARGNPNARLCFIGEGPGADEDRTGLHFVGARPLADEAE
ncbi:MAG: hypothetical protein KA978_29825, partial [Deltaproteobacteria bacterium]|nr:hypothetical protein [Deltaproteobacteria bacterium]